MISADFKRLDIKPGDRVLDAGCGSGRHACECHRHPGVFVAGMDINAEDLSAAKKNLTLHDHIGEHGGGAWGLAAGDVSNLPFPDGCFDVVICSEVMEHVPEEKKAASEIARVVKPGGRLVVSVPRRLPEKICWRLSREYRDTPGGHIRIYKKKGVTTRFEGVGFDNVSFHFAHSLHTPYWWMKCLAGIHRTDLFIIKLYHRFLVWDMMKKPRFTRMLERFLNPVLGKSIVIYFKKKK